MSKVIGYLRVSTIKQDTEKNKAQLLEYANRKKLGHVVFVQEIITGTKNWRKRKLGETLEAMGKGDILLAPELSRIGRSSLQIHQIVEYCRQSKIELHLVKQNMIIKPGKKDMATKTMLAMFALFAELERDLISERTKEALQVKKEQGIILGRPKGNGKSKLDIHREEIRGLIAIGVPQTKIAAKYHTTPVNLHRYIQRYSLTTAREAIK